jgi:hypothetical protein
MTTLRRLLLLFLLAVLAQGCAARRAALFQYATINSLLAVVFDLRNNTGISADIRSRCLSP